MNQKQKGFIQTPLLIAIIVSVLVLGSAGYFGVKQYQNYQAEQIEKEKVVQEAQQKKDLEVEKLRQEVEALKNKKPETITQTITKEVPAKNTEITVAEINKYITGVVKISCGNTSGSGTLAKSSNKYSVLTNYHVVKNLSANTPCLVVIEDTDGNGMGIFMTGSTILAWNDSTDVAVLDLKVYDKASNLGESFTSTPIGSLNYNISSLQNCPATMSVGSPVAIVGYPAFSEQELMIGGISMGVQLSRIVSNGIISGYANTDLQSGLPYKNYFISAKIDSGNSGGIAFSKNENGLCQLGIPTWLTVGNYETQGIVQNISNVTYK
ncbi:MAG: trypsin-like peptidase domain-containing protein [Bacilli bacterium]|nr:trypsin-like peptidase domain-containing protein [Bacilli bacterium]